MNSQRNRAIGESERSMTRYLALVLACALAACSKPSDAPSAAAGANTQASMIAPAAAFGAPVDALRLLHQSLVVDDAIGPPATPQPLRTSAQIAAAGCRRSDGTWACPKIAAPMLASGANATAAQCGPACTVSAWYVDPQNTTTCASDANSCTSATCAGSGVGPCSTWAQIVTRLGSSQPQYPYGQSVTLYFLSAQSAGQDVIFFEPRMSGGGIAVLNGQLAWTAAGAAFAAGTLGGGYGYSGAVASAGGTEMTMATVPAYVVANVVLNNTARASYANVDKVTTGTAYLTQPHTVASLTPSSALPTAATDNDWVASDNVVPYVLPNINVKRWQAQGADRTSTPTYTGSWVFGISTPNVNGANSSQWQLSSSSYLQVLSTSIVNGPANIAAMQGGRFGPYIMGVNFAGSVNWLSGYGAMFGGAMQGGLTALGWGDGEFADNAVIHSTVTVVGGNVLVLSAFSDGSWTAYGSPIFALGTFWGSYNMSLLAGSTFFNDTGSTFAGSALLTNGTLKLGTLTTGWAPAVGGTFTLTGASQVDVSVACAATGPCFPQTAPISWSLSNANGGTIGATGPQFSQATTANNFFVKGLAADTSIYNWVAGPTSGVTVTPANLDSYQGLYDPATGARYCNPN